jgi:hypothetical protein
MANKKKKAGCIYIFGFPLQETAACRNKRKAQKYDFKTSKNLINEDGRTTRSYFDSFGTSPTTAESIGVATAGALPAVAGVVATAATGNPAPVVAGALSSLTGQVVDASGAAVEGAFDLAPVVLILGAGLAGIILLRE